MTEEKAVDLDLAQAHAAGFLITSTAERAGNFVDND